VSRAEYFLLKESKNQNSNLRMSPNVFHIFWLFCEEKQKYSSGDLIPLKKSKEECDTRKHQQRICIFCAQMRNYVLGTSVGSTFRYIISKTTVVIHPSRISRSLQVYRSITLSFNKLYALCLRLRKIEPNL
jgi:hypothetical protein